MAEEKVQIINKLPYGIGGYDPLSQSANWPSGTVNAKPLLPVPKTTSGDITYVKQAPRDTIIFDEGGVNASPLEELLFEDLGGIELANVSRSDLVDGQEVSYSIVKNLSSLRRRFSPNNIISSSASLNTYFSRFAIDLIARGPYYPYVTEDGNVAIEVDTILPDEEIEVQVLLSGTIEEVEE